MDQRARSWRWTLLATLPALLLLAWQTSAVWPFFSDDAFISLRYSERLLAGDGLTWTDGERVEGYSNLLWVLLCAGLGAVGLDLVTAARLLGGAATLAGLVALAHALQPRDWRGALFAACAPVLAVSTQVVLAWTFAGLEGPLVFGLLAMGYGHLLRTLDAAPDVASWSARTLLRASVPFALACWARPDAPLWVASTALALVGLGRGDGLRRRVARGLVFSALPLATFGAQMLFRLAYHGDVVPNTAHVKADFDPGTWLAGWSYVSRALGAHAGLAVLALLGAIHLLLHRLVHRATHCHALLLVLPVLAWLAYLIGIGGDHFPGRRLLHGAVAPLVLLAAWSARHAARQAGARPAPRPTSMRRSTLVGTAAAGLLLLGAAGDVLLARTDPQTLELRGEIWEWRGREIGTTLRAAFAEERPLLAVDAAGAVPFYSRLPSLDLLGLCDRTIATTPLAGWLQTMRPEIPRPPGHLHGNGRYVMDRAPDLVLLGNAPCLPLATFPSACEFEDDPRFLDAYRCVMLTLADRQLLAGVVETLRVPMWVRRDGAVGVRSEAARIVVPAMLFGALQLDGPVVRRHQPATADALAEAIVTARLTGVVTWYHATGSAVVPTAAGPLQLELRSPAPVTADVDVPAGTWRARCEPAAPGTAVTATHGATPLAGAASTFVVPAAGRVTLALQAAADGNLPQRVDRVVLERLP